MPLLVTVGAFLVFGTISGTNTHKKKMEKDHNGNRPYKRAVLRDRAGDLTKEWYVENYAYDESTDSLLRRRIKIPLSFQTKKARIEEANKIIADTNVLLERGFHLKAQTTSAETDIVRESFNDLVICLDSVLDTISPTLRLKSTGTYRSAINKLKSFADGKVLDVKVFSGKDAVRFRDYMISTLSNSARTANNTLIHLNTVFGHLKER